MLSVAAEVSIREFASGFFLMCGGSLEEKLAEAFVLYDADGNGFLDGQEMRSLFESFCTVAMDVVCCSLSTATAVLSPDQSFGKNASTESFNVFRLATANLTAATDALAVLSR